MKKNFFIILNFLLIYFFSVNLYCYQKLSVGLIYEIKNKVIKQQITDIALNKPFLKSWIFFQKKGKNFYPCLLVENRIYSISFPIEKIDFLKIKLTIENSKNTITKHAIIFSKNRVFGLKKINYNNVYHLLVINNFVNIKDNSFYLTNKNTINKKLKNAFKRTFSLAMSYALQTDKKTKNLEKNFFVKTKYNVPRIILSSEEWLIISKKIKKRKKVGLFGGALAEINKEISNKQDEKIQTELIPTYSLDVILDEISAKGEYIRGFQVARSIWNDIIEGAIIYKATTGQRRIIAASIVFSQMEKNRLTKNSKNQLIKINFKNLNNINQCSYLWDPVKKEIKEFLKNNHDWVIIIPKEPVVFYSKSKPIYAMYAWFKVNSKTGRMIGMLPTQIHGAVSDEVAKIEGTLLKKIHGKIKNVTGNAPVKGYFSAIAGMYVISGGIFSGIKLTISNPEIVKLNEKDWKNFIAKHALDVCQKFLEENAELYDSYDALLGFWQGAMVLASGIGGKNAAINCAKKAINSITNKTINDAENFLKNKIKIAKETAKEKFFDIVESYNSKLGKTIKDIITVKNTIEQGEALVNKSKEASIRYKKAMDELYSKIYR